MARPTCQRLRVTRGIPVAEAAVTKITDLPDPEDDVDLDLDAEDQLLREAVGQPLTVRLAGKVISVPHPTDWPHTANTAAARADFSAWAQAVLTEQDHDVFLAANLRNYQVNALFESVNKRAGVGPGKSPSSRGSSRNKAQALEADLHRYYGRPAGPVPGAAVVPETRRAGGPSAAGVGDGHRGPGGHDRRGVRRPVGGRGPGGGPLVIYGHAPRGPVRRGAQVRALVRSAHVEKGKAGKPPEPLPRPGVRRGRKARKSRLTDAQRRMLDPRLSRAVKPSG